MPTRSHTRSRYRFALVAAALAFCVAPAIAQDAPKTKPAAHGSQVKVPGTSIQHNTVSLKELESPNQALMKSLKAASKRTSSTLSKVKNEQRYCSMAYSALRVYLKDPSAKSRDRVVEKINGYVAARATPVPADSPLKRVVDSVRANDEKLDITAASVKAFNTESDRMRVATGAATEERKGVARLLTSLQLLLKNKGDAKAKKRYQEAVDLYGAARKRRSK